MADEVTRRVIEIDAKIASGALANLKSMDSSVGSLEKTISKGADTLKSFAVGFAGAFTLGAFVTGIKSSIDHMDELNKQVQKVGMEAEAFQKLQYAAELSDVSTEQLNKSLVKLSVNLQDVDQGSTDAAKALRSMGVRGTDSPEQALSKIADAFQKMPDGARKTALAVNALGKGAEQLIPLLNQGADGLKAMGDEAAQMGIIISGKSLAAAEEFNDTITKIQKVGAGAFSQMAQGMLPALQGIATAFFDIVKEGTTFISVGQSIGDAAVWITEQFIKASAAVEALGKLLGGLAAASAAIAHGELRQSATIMRETIADINKLGDDAEKRIAKLLADVDKARNAPPPQRKLQTPDGTTPTAAAAKTTDAYADALKNLASQADQAARALAIYQGRAGASLDIDKAKQLAGIIEKIEEKTGKPVTGQAYLSLYNAIVKTTDAQKKLTDAAEKEKEARQALADFNKEAAEGQARIDAMQKQADDDRAARLLALRDRVQEIIDPGRQLRELMTEIREGMDEGTISFNDGAEALEKLSSEMNGTTKAAEKMAPTFTDTLLDAINGFSRQASEAIVDFASGVKGSFEDMAKSVLRQIAVMAVQAAVVLPLFNTLKNAMQFGSFAQGGVFDAGGLVPFARGGVVNTPTLFPFAQGIGLMGEAGPEAIMPLARTASGDLGVRASDGGGGNGVNVYVMNNASGATASARTEKRADGGVDIRILVEDAVERGFATGRFDQTLSSNYGVARRGRN